MSGKFIATIDEIQKLCGYISDDRTIAAYFGIDPERVALVRFGLSQKSAGPTGYARPRDGNGLEQQRYYEEDAEKGSRELNERLQSVFRNWEQKHGFQEGAAQILVPAGYNPDCEREAA